MLILVAVLFIAGVNSQDDWLKHYLEELRDILKNGDESIGIPALDPLFVNESFAFVQKPKIDMNAHIEGYLKNYSNYIVHDAQLDKDLNSSFLLTFLNPVLHVKFSIGGNAMSVIPLDSNGLIEISFDNFKLLLNSHITGNNKTIQIKEFYSSYTINNIDIDAEGILSEYGFTFILRDVIRDVTFPLLNKYQNQIIETLNTELPIVVNENLKNFGLRNIIEMAKDKFIPP